MKKQQNNDKIVVIFIGGAGEKESYYLRGPHHCIEAVKILFEESLPQEFRHCYEGIYLDYREAYKDKLEEVVVAEIPEGRVPVFVVGHSLGGWNGAELTRILSDWGYDVQMLITLDPVGKGFWVYSISRIYFSEPKPKCDYWINIKADPAERDSSDIVADLGERWKLTSGPDVNEVFNVHHYDVEKMMTRQLSSGGSALSLLLDRVIAQFKIKER